jgi:hypothetical protein
MSVAYRHIHDDPLKSQYFDEPGLTDPHSYLNSEAIRPDAVSAPTSQSGTLHTDMVSPGPCIRSPPQIQGSLPVFGKIESMVFSLRRCPR